MKKQKRKAWIYQTAISILLIIALCTGCGFAPEKTYSMQDYYADEANGLYDFSDQIADMGNVVAAAMYENNQILICQDVIRDAVLYRKLWLFSYLTGEMKLCSDLEVATEPDFYATSSRYSVLSTSPFVLSDMYENKIYIYTDDLSAYSTVSLEEYAMPSGMYIRSGSFYFMDFNTYKVYKYAMDELAAKPVNMSYETLRENAMLIFNPDVNVFECYLSGVSKLGDRLKLFAENPADGESYYYIYDMADKEFEEMYQMDSGASTVWNSWDECKYLNEVLPSATARYEFVDYMEKQKRSIKIEPQNIYSIVRCDENISDTQPYILFYAVDENSELIKELFLWEYAKAESEAAGSAPLRQDGKIPEEIEYEHLTEKAEMLEEKYGINIIMGENVICDFEAYDYEQVTDENRIALALEELELALDAFPDGMCGEMAEDYAAGFNVYLCGTFTPKNNENISDAGAFYTFDNGYYNLVINIMLDQTEANVIHEMTHAIDNYFVFCGASEQLEQDWQACNPEGFTYLQSYFGYEELYEYTYADDYDSVDDIYFVDTYARTFPGEDRSRVFEYFGSEYFKDDWILEAQPLRCKARILLDYCTQYMECFSGDDDYGLKRRSEEVGW